MKKIICGFAGIGKSTMSKESVGFVDLESTPFKKNWKVYTDVAMHMAANGYNVMLSCHKELRDMLLSNGADFEVVIPCLEDKDDYLCRYEERGNTKQFIELFEDKWDDFINEILEDRDKMHVVVLESGDFLNDYIDKEISEEFGGAF